MCSLDYFLSSQDTVYSLFAPLLYASGIPIR